MIPVNQSVWLSEKNICKKDTMDSRNLDTWYIKIYSMHDNASHISVSQGIIASTPVSQDYVNGDPKYILVIPKALQSCATEQ